MTAPPLQIQKSAPKKGLGVDPFGNKMTAPLDYFGLLI